ncbi:strawberry notch-like NTP hydrolase domain-containing protein [Sphingobium sp. YR768]|uniref:strawberry notch-like NTP hydrolase domain-containing protein n=1 Tax=Sphingobium sp. YR768 TaxID=1884365 RepID=UPI000B83D545|nr:strawberry notch family protein [Sphingobium sp. YR768]
MTRSLLAALESGSDPLDQKIWTIAAVARSLADLIHAGQPVSRQRLSRLMTVHFGSDDSSGAWSLRDAYDALELAQVTAFLQRDNGGNDDAQPDGALLAITALAERLPTQSYRSERQIDMQQFSTPAPLAFLASVAAAITPHDVVLEPSAGTGMLAGFAKAAGARLVLNERDPLRAGLLAQAFGDGVTRHDAEHIDDLLDAAQRPSLVLINPPFSRSEARGKDRHAGARHLRSALARLKPGGRCVAIMSPAFAHDGSAASGYEAVAALVPPRVEITVEGRPFAKHGTSISVRLLVYDKGWQGTPLRVTVNSVDALLPHILSLPPRLGGEEPPDPSQPAGRRHSAGNATRNARPVTRSLLSGKKGAIAPLPKPRPIVAIDGTVEPLAYTVRDTPLSAAEQVGIYIPWRLSRMEIAGGKAHPDQLVESIAMSSILPPEPTYVPMLPRCAVAAMSDAQLETLIYAGQAFERDLPGLYAPNEAGTLLSPDGNGEPYRMGFFIGDGTGVGKGQQVAACIMDQWSRDRRKAVWISKSAALIEDARRDMRRRYGASLFQLDR